MPIDAVVRSEGKDNFMVDENPIEEPKEVKKGEVAEEKTHFKKVEVTNGVSELGYIQNYSVRKIAWEYESGNQGSILFTV